MNTVYIKRLEKLADFMEKLPRNKFDISSWVGGNWKGKANLSCGTTACMMGWATTFPSLRKLGLRLNTRGIVILAQGNKEYGVNTAACKIFGISPEDVSSLFYATSYYDTEAVKSRQIADMDFKLSPKQAAARIRNFLKAKAEENV